MDDKDAPILGNDRDREEYRNREQNIPQDEPTPQNNNTEPVSPQEETFYPTDLNQESSEPQATVPPEINTETTNTMAEKPTLVNRCRALQERDTSYVFLFGKRQTGKTAITTALCYHMGVDDEGDLKLRNDADRQGRNMLKGMLTQPSTGIFLDRSDRETITQIDLQYTPSKKNNHPAKFTFIEMSGEDLEKFEEVDDAGRRPNLPENINDFLRCPDLDLIFMLVVDHQTATQDDQFIKEFLDFISEKQSNNNRVQILLLVTKWDNYQGKYKNDVEGFVRTNMPLTYSGLRHFNQTITHFSVGQVVEEELLKFEHDRPRQVKYWLYHAVSGKPFPGTQKPWLQRMFDKLSNPGS